ncbi:MAG: hypothetical protein KGL50_07875, partial [Burkholderiales bacterium]|nr:hypothetical protein [Burkholderiales bacterium]
MEERGARAGRNRSYLAAWLACALLIAYSSTVVGPTGLHFVPLDPAEAWRAFTQRAFTWVPLGSDQRADWMGNLILYLPFGFLLAGALGPGRGAGGPRLAAAGVAWALALAFVLVLKYAQLYFPPRTVMLNYVVAQGAGAALGIAAFGVWRRLMEAGPGGGGRRPPQAPEQRLRLILQGYAAALALFILMPLDFALSPHDLWAQIGRLPELATQVPGAGRPAIVRAALMAASGLAAAPFGMLLALGPHGRRRSLAEVGLRGAAWMTALWGLSTLVLSASPSLPTLLLRMAGTALGAWALRWVQRQDAHRLLHRLRAQSVAAALPYLLLLGAVNGLVSRHWLTPAEAWHAAYPLGWLPLFDYYIVSKGTAARNIVAHALMYAPVGVFAWLNGGRPAVALRVAALLALAVESARYFRPGLEGDVNAVVVAGLSAYLAARAMPALWQAVSGAALGPAPAARAGPRTGHRADHGAAARVDDRV